MMLIIVGQNRVKFVKIKPKDYGKDFANADGQLYKVYPDGLTRVRWTDWRGNVHEDEAVIYLENSIVPYHPRAVDYSADRTLAQIDEHKLANGGKSADSVFKAASSMWRTLAPIAPMIIAGVILIWALL